MTHNTNEDFYYADATHSSDFIHSISTYIDGVYKYNLNADAVLNTKNFINKYADVDGSVYGYQTPTHSGGGNDSPIHRSLSAFLVYINNQNIQFTGWSDFADRWAAWQQGTDLSSNPPANPLYKAFFTEFLKAMSNPGTQITNDNNLNDLDGNLAALGTNWDWSILTSPPLPGEPANPVIDFNSTNPDENPFIAAFNHFITGLYDSSNSLDNPILNNTMTAIVLNGQTVPFGTSAGDTSYIHIPTTPLDNFLAAFRKYLTSLVTMQKDINPDPSHPQKLTSYEEIYMAYVPGATHDGFAAAMKKFYKDTVAANVYFQPSQFIDKWMEQMQAVGSIQPNTIGISSLAGNDSSKVQVINRILVLLIKIIKSLQEVGIEQAGHLRFTTSYQRAYTTLQTQVPIFLRSSTGPLGGTGDQAIKDRGEINTVFNANIIDNLRNLRGLQEDSAKKQQSDLNQTNDAVNQQTDMATTFIQQMSSLLSSILR